MQKFGIVNPRFACQTPAQFFVVCGCQFDRAGKCTNVKSGTAGDDRTAASRMNLFDFCNGVLSESRSRVAFIRVQKTDQVMRYLPELCIAGSRGAHRHSRIDLTRISADDFGLEAAREVDCEVGFAR